MQDDSVPGIRPTTGNEVEARVSEMNDALLEDVAAKTGIGLQEISRHKNLITNIYGYGYVDVMTSEISSDLNTTKDFKSCV